MVPTYMEWTLNTCIMFFVFWLCFGTGLPGTVSALHIYIHNICIHNVWFSSMNVFGVGGEKLALMLFFRCLAMHEITRDVGI